MDAQHRIPFCIVQLHTFRFVLSFGAIAHQWGKVSSFTRFIDHTQRRTTVGRTPLDEWPARRRDLYLTTHNTHNRHTSILLTGFELTVLAGERSQIYALDGAAPRTSIFSFRQYKMSKVSPPNCDIEVIFWVSSYTCCRQPTWGLIFLSEFKQNGLLCTDFIIKASV